MSNELVRNMWQALAKSPYLMISLNNKPEHSEPMRAQLEPEANGYFWFYTSKGNRIADGGKAMAQFASKDHQLFACIAGYLVEETDQEVISRYWSNPVEAWYEGGREDPKLKMMRFELDTAEIWSVDPSVVGMLKLSSGATLSSGDMGKHNKIAF